MITASVTLSPQHQPTGNRCIIGFGKRMERPDKVEIINYSPTQLNHFRFHYADRYVDERFVSLNTGTQKTNQTDCLTGCLTSSVWLTQSGQFLSDSQIIA